MKHAPAAQRLTVVMLLLITALTSSAGLRGSSAAEENTIRIEAGETLEIGTDTASPKSQFSWILTKDRKFQSAQRTRFFQTRLAEPGTYVLDVSVQDPVTSANGYRAFTIVVTEPTGAIPLPTGDKTKALSAQLTTDPPAFEGSAYIGTEGGIVKINASGSDGNISTYHIDLDTSVDSDADGDPMNDKDNLGTLSEKSGGNLYVFMLPSTLERKVKLTVTDINVAEPKTNEVNIRFAPQPASSSQATVTQNPNSPILMERDGAVVRFSAKLDEAQIAGKETIYEWDFGDKTKSLLFTPTHTYSAPGTYTVGLKIREISTAAMLYEGIDSITIDSNSGTSSSADTSSSTSSSSSSPSGSEKSSASLKGVLQVSFIILLLLAFAIGLYVLFTWIKRKTATGLQKTLEKMEGTIVQKDVIDETKPVVMKLKKETAKVEEVEKQSDVIIEKEKAKEEFKTQERTNETPTSGSGPVPSWLAKASTKSTETTPTTTGAAKPTPKISTPLPSPAPVNEQGPTPAWLKPAPAPTVTQNPPSAPKPPVVAPSAPKTSVTSPAPTQNNAQAPSSVSKPAVASTQNTNSVASPPVNVQPAPQSRPAQTAPQPKVAETQKAASVSPAAPPNQQKNVTPPPSASRQNANAVLPQAKIQTSQMAPPQVDVKPLPPTPVTPKPAVAPVPQPKPVEISKPVTAPVSETKPIEVTKPVAAPVPQPKPVETPKTEVRQNITVEATQQKPVSPVAVTTQDESNAMLIAEEDEPIAIIQADSLSQK